MFLVLHSLKGGPCVAAAAALERVGSAWCSRHVVRCSADRSLRRTPCVRAHRRLPRTSYCRGASRPWGRARRTASCPAWRNPSQRRAHTAPRCCGDFERRAAAPSLAQMRRSRWGNLLRSCLRAARSASPARAGRPPTGPAGGDAGPRAAAARRSACHTARQRIPGAGAAHAAVAALGALAAQSRRRAARAGACAR
jgi:hypothetical protein